jgi:hypothetical protein
MVPVPVRARGHGAAPARARLMICSDPALIFAIAHMHAMINIELEAGAQLYSYA